MGDVSFSDAVIQHDVRFPHQLTDFVGSPPVPLIGTNTSRQTMNLQIFLHLEKLITKREYWPNFQLDYLLNTNIGHKHEL
jgi:hypothetical protein